MFVNKLKPLNRLIILTALLLITGCSKSFVVTSEVPQPLIERMPVTAKMVYSDEFKDYVYVEAGDDRALEEVDFGQAQVGLFDRVFGDLLTLVEPSSTEYDLKIEPQILDFQYSVPAETKINVYEIWLKYRLKVSDSADTQVADWVVKGYGKTPTSMLESQLKAFNTASNVALRDIGAQLAIGFPTQPSIEGYVSRNRNFSADEVVQPSQRTSALENNSGGFETYEEIATPEETDDAQASAADVLQEAGDLQTLDQEQSEQDIVQDQTAEDLTTIAAEIEDSDSDQSDEESPE